MKLRVLLVSAFGSLLCALRVLCGESPAQRLDPGAWGSDHVGKPVPEYVTGDECLFCHRSDIGPTWPRNRHQRTTRDVEAASPALAALKKASELKPLADEVNVLLGHVRSVRFLKKSSAYGKLAILTGAAWHAAD